MTRMPTPGTMLGDCEILAELSSGGMGQVLLGRRHGAHGFEKLVAIKTIRADLLERATIRSMFLDEARLVARLTHPAIAQVYDFGEQDEILYLIMEFVEGIPLSRLLKTNPNGLPVGVSCRLIAELCRGLHAAHELKDRSGTMLGVVHRDVSPQNVMLTYSGRVKIIDFGIAWVRDRTTPQTVIGEIKGKPSYMSPEQLASKPIDRRTDVRAAGIILWELLTGESLFGRDSVAQTMFAAASDPVPPPSERNAEVPAELDAIVLQGADRNPNERFQTALELARELDAFVAALGSEDLESFAVRALSADRTSHDHEMQQLVGVLENARVGRAGEGRDGQVPTVRLPSSEHDPERYLADTVTVNRSVDAARPPGGESPTARLQRQHSVVESSATDVSFVSRRRAWLIVMAALSIFAVAGAGASWETWWPRLSGSRSDAGRSEPAAPAPTPALRPTDSPAPPVHRKAPPAAVGQTTNEDATRVLAAPAGKQRLSKRPRHRKRKRTGKGEQPRRVEAATPPDTPRQPPKLGSITIAAEPYAHVRIDEKQVGNTPLRNHRLPVGTHLVELISPDTGEVRLRRRVEISEGVHQRITAR